MKCYKTRTKLVPEKKRFKDLERYILCSCSFHPKNADVILGEKYSDEEYLDVFDSLLDKMVGIVDSVETSGKFHIRFEFFPGHGEYKLDILEDMEFVVDEKDITIYL